MLSNIDEIKKTYGAYLPEIAITKENIIVYQVVNNSEISCVNENGETIELKEGDYFTIKDNQIIGWPKEEFNKKFIILREYSDLYVFRKDNL